MRLCYPILCAVLAFAPVALAEDSASWISNAGGSVTRDAHGHITAIDLRASWVSDSDIANLSAIPTLTRLDLSETRITDHGLRELKNAPAIADLNLRYAELITDEGISALKTWKHLKHLDLQGTKVTDSALQHLTGLTSLESLDLGYVLVTDAGMEALTSLTSLKELSLGGDKLTDAGLQPLRQLPGLTVLELGGSQREDSGIWTVSFAAPGLEAIATLKDLHQLKLSRTLISASGLSRLKGLSRLDVLDLHDCRRIGDDSVAILAGMPSLRSIDLTGTKVTSAGLAKLHRAKPNCQIHLTSSGPQQEAQSEEP